MWQEEVCLSPGITRDKTMTDKLIIIANDDTQNYTLVDYMVETFRHST